MHRYILRSAGMVAVCLLLAACEDENFKTGRDWFDVGNYAKATYYLSLALERNPKDAEIRGQLARAAARSGNLGEAARWLQEAQHFGLLGQSETTARVEVQTLAISQLRAAPSIYAIDILKQWPTPAAIPALASVARGSDGDLFVRASVLLKELNEAALVAALLDRLTALSGSDWESVAKIKQTAGFVFINLSAQEGLLRLARRKMLTASSDFIFLTSVQADAIANLATAEAMFQKLDGVLVEEGLSTDKNDKNFSLYAANLLKTRNDPGPVASSAIIMKLTSSRSPEIRPILLDRITRLVQSGLKGAPLVCDERMSPYYEGIITIGLGEFGNESTELKRNLLSLLATLVLHSANSSGCINSYLGYLSRIDRNSEWLNFKFWADTGGWPAIETIASKISADRANDTISYFGSRFRLTQEGTPIHQKYMAVLAILGPCIGGTNSCKEIARPEALMVLDHRTIELKFGIIDGWNNSARSISGSVQKVGSLKIKLEQSGPFPPLPWQIVDISEFNFRGRNVNLASDLPNLGASRNSDPAPQNGPGTSQRQEPPQGPQRRTCFTFNGRQVCE